MLSTELDLKGFGHGAEGLGLEHSDPWIRPSSDIV